MDKIQRKVYVCVCNGKVMFEETFTELEARYHNALSDRLTHGQCTWKPKKEEGMN